MRQRLTVSSVGLGDEWSSAIVIKLCICDIRGKYAGYLACARVA